MKKQTHLVCQHLEMVSRKAVEQYQDILRKFVRGRHGIYSLYRKNKLCYVGLATNLKTRLHHHLRDRHSETWDKFSVYLTIESDHLRELEALTIRIAAPKENRQKGKLQKSQDMRKLFQRALKERQKRDLHELMGNTSVVSRHVKVRKAFKGRKPVLLGYFPDGQSIRMSYKGREYVAHVRKNGTIGFRGKTYTSPSLAAKDVTKRAMNGWYWWKYERAPGDWVRIDELRK